MLNETSSTPQYGLSRRTVVKSAAWSVPVIAAAATVPFAAATGVLPAATFWGTGATVAVVSGNTTRYNLFGTDTEGDDAVLPAGSTIVIQPQPGVTITPVSVVGAVLAVNADGSLTYTITGSDVTTVDIRFRPTGPAGAAAYDITTTVPNVAPYTETINVQFQ